jgi:hypothetical protein
VFRYRGEQPLSLKIDHGQRTELLAVHHALTPDDFIKLAARCRLRPTLVQEECPFPLVALERNGFRALAGLGSRVSGTSLFRSVLLRAALREPGAKASNRVSVNTDPLVPMKLLADEDGALTAETPLVFGGGVTTEWIVRSLERWQAVVRRCQRQIRKGMTRGPRRPKSLQGRLSIH